MSKQSCNGKQESGVVYAEFLISFIPLFLLFLAGVQLAFLASARIVVKHAAVLAARAAVLVIDDDPYFDETSSTRRKMLATGKSGAEPRGSAALLGRVGADTVKAPEGEPQKGCDRLKRVRHAAYVPLSVLAPPPAQLARLVPGVNLVAALGGHGGRSLESAIGTSPWLRVASGLFVYNRLGAAVTFPEEPGSDKLRDLSGEGAAFLDDEVVTVRITYLFGCYVPLARDLVCRWLREDGELGELGHAEWAKFQKPLLALSGERFVVLQAEASMPNQGAPYEYASELCKTKKKLAHCRGKS